MIQKLWVGRLVTALAALLVSTTGWAQSVEDLQMQYEKEMKIMQEAFQEQLDAHLQRS